MRVRVKHKRPLKMPRLNILKTRLRPVKLVKKLTLAQVRRTKPMLRAQPPHLRQMQPYLNRK